MDFKKEKKKDLIKIIEDNKRTIKDHKRTIHDNKQTIDTLTRALYSESEKKTEKEYIIVNTNPDDSKTITHLKKRIRQVADQKKKLIYINELQRLLNIKN